MTALISQRPSFTSVMAIVVTKLNHNVSMIYNSAINKSMYTKIIEIIYSDLLFNQDSIEVHQQDFANRDYVIDLLMNRHGLSINDNHVNFTQQLFEFASVEMYNHTAQASIVTNILTGTPVMSSFILEQHYDGWYLVIY